MGHDDFARLPKQLNAVGRGRLECQALRFIEHEFCEELEQRGRHLGGVRVRF